jgi:integrase
MWPLSSRCLEILQAARVAHSVADLIFAGSNPEKPLSDMTLTKLLRDMGLAERATVHGFRSSFKVWCAQAAKVSDEISEAALAHAIPQKVRAAYLRTDFLEQRRELMARWADYVSHVPQELTETPWPSSAGQSPPLPGPQDYTKATVTMR